MVSTSYNKLGHGCPRTYVNRRLMNGKALPAVIPILLVAPGTTLITAPLSAMVARIEAFTAKEIVPRGAGRIMLSTNFAKVHLVEAHGGVATKSGAYRLAPTRVTMPPASFWGNDHLMRRP